jgi:hypothetical protein
MIPLPRILRKTIGNMDQSISLWVMIFTGTLEYEAGMLTTQPWYLMV